jgi:hypothetical protein
MKALSVTLKDLQLLVKDKLAIQHFLLPLLFVLIFSGGSSPLKQHSGYPLPLAVVNLIAAQGANRWQASRRLAARTELYDQAEASLVGRERGPPPVHRLISAQG